MGFAGDLKDLSLADLLQTIQQNRNSGTLRLGGQGEEEDDVLVQDAYKAAAEAHVRDAVCDLFLKPRGHFEFKDGDGHKERFDPDLVAARAAVEAQGVILEGSRRVDEWSRLSRKIGGMTELY